MAGLKKQDVTCELWREYDFAGRTYHIADPATLYIGETTHRIVDSHGVVHCVPKPGIGDCVLRWKSKDPNKPVEF